MGTLQQAADATTTRRRSFVQTPTEIVRDPTLSFGAKAAYGAVRSYDWESINGACFASHERLAADLGCSTRTLQKYLRELLDRRLITRRRTGRENHYVIAQDASACASDARDLACQTREISRVVSISRRREEDEGSRRSRSGGEEEARARPDRTTTTTGLPLDAEEAEELVEDAGELLTRLDDLSEKATGRQPRRRPGDWERALALTRYWHGLDDDEGPRILKPVIWGWGDEWTRSKVLAINGVPTIAQYEGMAARYAAEPKVTCDLCHQPYVPSKRERAAIKSCAAINRQAELTCPRCREDCGL